MSEPETQIDLTVDLNNEDESGLPWTFLDEALNPSVIREGAWIVVGEGSTKAVAQVVEIDGDIVRIRPLPGPVDRHRHLLSHRVA
ncbi:MAG TPA: hypothetical protein VG412_02510 [Acidimicrobiales bacterium]|jgi:hypothetical protein|nr:hypothetical protein [Acidimicrobiales bacterium]